jgi:putative SOS response-associated peptidase YedK
MCGRFTQLYEWRRLMELHGLVGAPRNLQSRFNIAPTEPVDVIGLNREGRPGLTEMRWWLVPWFWKKPLKQAPPGFNARVESIAGEKPMWRDAFARHRCLIPASGFFEWVGPKEDRRPFYITRQDGLPMTFAGLYDAWKNPETGERMFSAAIITAPANDWMRPIHDRMPVMLEKDQFAGYLAKPDLALLKPPANDNLMAVPVGKQVNSSLYKEADTIAPVETAGRQ